MKDETDYKTAYETAMIGFKMQMQEIERLNNIIKEAIEYINWNLDVNEEVIDYFNFDANFNKLLEILKGSDKE